MTPLQLKPVAAMSHDERRAELAQVADLLHEFRFLAEDKRIFALMPLLLRLLHRGEDIPADGRLEAPPQEFVAWLHAFGLYLFAAANLPDLHPHAVADARWALRLAGVADAEIDAVGASGQLDLAAVERLVARLLVERPWAATASTAGVGAGALRGPRRSRRGGRSARRRGRS